MKDLTKTQLRMIGDLIDYWVPMLRLQDWDTTINIIEPEEMEELSGSAGTLGYCQPILVRKMAIIHLLRPDSPQYSDEPGTFEDTLVHELLHIHFAITDPSMIVLEEHAVCSLAGAFVKLRNQANDRTRQNCKDATRNQKGHKPPAKPRKERKPRSGVKK